MSDLIIFASIVFVKIYGQIDFSFLFFCSTQLILGPLKELSVVLHKLDTD